MLIISIVHQKGGVGKTTLALNIAYCLSENLKVALTDTDLQGSLSGLSDFIDGVDLIPLEAVKTQSLIGYDVVLIDTPPYLSTELESIFKLSDFVLIPTKAGYLDVLAIKATIGLFHKAQLHRPSLKGGIVLNMLVHGTSLTEEVKELLKAYDMPLLVTSISQRVSYARSPMTGGIFRGEDEKAKTEIVNLTNELLDQLEI